MNTSIKNPRPRQNRSFIVAVVCERRRFPGNPAVIGARRAPLHLFRGFYLFLLPALIAGLGLILAGRIMAQTFRTLYSFTGLDTNHFNSDGAYPYAGLILSGNTLYGTATGGGSSGNGTVFAVNTDGTGFTNLHSFTARDPGTGPNSDGANPLVGLILSGNSLYGREARGGRSWNRSVFVV